MYEQSKKSHGNFYFSPKTIKLLVYTISNGPFFNEGFEQICKFDDTENQYNNKSLVGISGTVHSFRINEKTILVDKKALT